MNRRSLIHIASTSALAMALGSRFVRAGEMFEITKTPEEWQKVLTPAQFATLREEDTEAKFSSALLEEHRKGTFNCAGCALALYSSEMKYDSGTGWPSFFDHLPNAIATKDDNGLFVARTEVHCSRCGGHLGHVFDDGPKPTGLRYCMNGVALNFAAVAA